MEDLYYRKERSSSKRSYGVRRLLKDKRIRYAVIIALPVIVFMTFSNKGLLQRIHLESQKREIQTKIYQAQEEQFQLQEQSRALDKDPRALEKVAREKYGMIREGETVYKVRKEK
jgi:cell division protein FtsB